MILSIIAAFARNRVIGRDGTLPWQVPEDLKRFKALTMGHPIVMGRKTCEAIDCRPLPGRENIVITSRADFSPEGFTVRRNLEEALVSFKNEDQEVFIIGGQSLFMQTLPLADRLYLTELDMVVEGDTFFPEIPQELFVEVSSWHIEGNPDQKLLEYHRRVDSL